MIYHVEYDGYYEMRWHDDEQNALKRWFDNYKLERCASFASKYEWLIVKEVSSDNKHRKVRFICEIGDDGRGTKREVIMDHTAPPAPMLTFAAKQRYEPPPPKTEQQIRKEIKWNAMVALGYRPVRRLPVQPTWNGHIPSAAVADMLTVEYEIEWVLKQQPVFIGIDYGREQPKPKPPTHRRNV